MGKGRKVEGMRGQLEKQELRYNMYRYTFSMINVIVIYGKQVLIF